MSKRPFNITRESYNLDISNEYNAVDWPQFFLGTVNTLWRAITNETETRIEFPGLLISLLVGKWSDFGKIVGLIGPGIYNQGLKAAIDELRGKAGNLTLAHNHYVMPGDTNMYKILFVEYKKVQVSEIKDYQELFDIYKKQINKLKSEVCVKLPRWRPCSTSEITDLKLFKPDKARKEMDVAVAEFKRRDEKFGKFAEEVAKWIEANLIEYVANNIKVD